MSSDISTRERKVDLEKLTLEEQENLGKQIGDKIAHHVDLTIADVNRFLKVYGLQAKMQILLEPIEQPKGE